MATAEVTERTITLTLNETEAYVIHNLVGRTYGGSLTVRSIYDALDEISPKNTDNIRIWRDDNKNFIVDSA